MKKINLKNKKIGIWGMGIVGKSVFNHVQQFTDQIQLMDQSSNTSYIAQTPENIAKFLEHNDFIIPSPGIILHDYQNYAHKFIQELDIFAQENKNYTIAITGTVGKTSITSLLQQCTPDSIAAGNIGHAMLNLCTNAAPPSSLQSTLFDGQANTQSCARPECFAQQKVSRDAQAKIILELSSYQLHWSQNFAPDLAIWTNFYPNHLDHHRNEAEYFVAKCNLLKYQKPDQIALLPYDLIDKIQQCVTPQAQIYLFSTENKIHTIYSTFFIQNNQLLLHQNNQTAIIFDNFNQLPEITFTQNWLIILAALHLQNIELSSLLSLTQKFKPEPHRLEFVKNLNKVAVYNDSKSTVWQATKSAVDRFEHKRIALFLGGISKGTDRSPLIAHLQNKNVTVFAFGKEAEMLSTMCEQFQIPYCSMPTLQESLKQYKNKEQNFDILLFSPAGASFDLFKNFEDRGEQFKKIIRSLE